jgi:hypothetical protein
MADVFPFGQYAPDVSVYKGGHSESILNVVPRADGYGPFKSFGVATSALPAACRGAFVARKSDGTVVIFAGTSTRLWQLNNTTLGWTPVSEVLALTSISNATPAVLTLNSHGLSVGDAIVLSTGGALPAGLVVGTVYYVISAGFGANSFQVALTPGGAAINTTDAGSGTHSFTSYYSALTSTEQWQFCQAGNLVFAVQANAPPQVFNLASSTAFADLGGSPPQARYCAIVGRFLVLSGLLSNPFRIHWSGLNDYDEWTSGTNSSDFQDLSDGGIVRGVAGGEYGLIFQDSTIRRMIYAPGSDVIFQIERITEDKGLFAPYSIIRADEQVFACLADGFHRIRPGGNPEPIGRERVDRTFFEDVDTTAPHLFIGANDPSNSRVYWAYKSVSGSTGLYDKILCYDYVLDKFTPVIMSGEYLTSLAAPGITLESLDTQFSSIDAMEVPFDDFSSVALTKLAGFDSDHKAGFFTGSNLEATLETAEQTLDRRVRVKGARPITDAATCYVSFGKRETLQEDVTYSTEQAVNVRGLCPANVSTRIARAKLRIPAAETWEFATGVEPEFRAEGRR